MKRHSWDFAWYRFRATFARQRAGYLSVILVIGLTGGLSFASLSAARRTQSSYATFLTSTNPSTLTMAVFGASNGGMAGPSLLAKIRSLPDVKDVHTLVAGAAVPLSPTGAPRLATLNEVNIAGGLNGYLTKEDRLAVLQGRLINPRSMNEVELTPGAARIWGVHVNEVVPIGFYAPSQSTLPGFGTAKVKPHLTVDATVTGIVILPTEVVQDDVDDTFGFAFVSPVLTRKVARFEPQWKTPIYYALQLRHGDAGIAKVESELIGLVPPHFTYEFHVASTVTSTVELAVKPESVALGAFGLIAALVCLILSAQSLSRQLRRGSDDRRVLQALGARRLETMLEGFMATALTLVLGVALAIAVAVALSPLAPLGPVRPVYPDRGLSFDGTVLGGGAALLLVLLGSAAFIAALVATPRRARRTATAPRGSTITRRLQGMGMPLAPSLGANFALESPRQRGDVPVRSVLTGAALAVTLMVATLTFASGLDALVSRPALYGWNWDYLLQPTNNLPLSSLQALNHDPDVAQWSGANYNVLTIDGQTVPMIMAKPRARVMPPILSGHGLDNDHQIVLGGQTLALIHKKVGDTVRVSYGSPASAPVYIPPTSLTIVGTATFPAVGYATQIAEHTSMGTGALLSTGIEPKSFAEAISSRDPNLEGPELAFIRLRPGVSAAEGKRSLEAIADAANKSYVKDPQGFGNTVEVLGVLRPAQIVDYRTIGATPVVLASGLALGAIVALTLTLIASVRRRRRDLAVLKTLGFTRRMVAGVVAWQASVVALVGVGFGVPLGILLGRELWTHFARNINAVPFPNVPVLAVTLVGVGTLVAAILAAAWPGRSAANTPPALVLRSE